MKAEIARLFNSEFSREEQLKLVAATLEHLRATYPAKWASVGKGERLPEFKALVRSLLRAADESVDYQATVAYVSQAVVEELEAIASFRQGGRLYKRDLADATKFSHEHATPVEVLVRTVTLAENRSAPILDILDALCCRVLVTKAERIRIDTKHAWTVPSSLEWTRGFAIGVRTLMPSLLPLIRYHEVDRGLALSLIALSPTREEQMRLFRSLMCAQIADFEPCYIACKRRPHTSFVLSDDIYIGTARVRSST